MINGSAEFDTYLSRSTSKDAKGVVTSDSKGTDFMHKYNLSLDSSIFPLLKLSAGSTFLQDINMLHDMGTSSRSKSTTLSPYLDLTLNNSLYQAALGYSRNQNWQSGSQDSAPSMVNDDYHASFGWRPVGLPDLSVRLSHANSFDVDRQTQDMTTNMATLGSQYTYKVFKLGYQFTGTESMDNLHGTDNTSFLNNGSISYSDQFFNQRVSVYSHYNINQLTSTTKAGSGGFVETDQNAYVNMRLYSYNSEPWRGTADENTVIETNYTDFKSALINLGAPAAGEISKLWSIGLGFSYLTEVNGLNVFVSVANDSVLQQLQHISDLYFNWQIWVRDQDTDSWRQTDDKGNLVTASAVFDPVKKCFRLKLNTPVKNRFLKIVVNRLQSTIDPRWSMASIIVTDLQAFLSQPAAQVEGSSSRVTQSFNMDVRTRLVDALYHNLNLSLSTTTGGDLTYVLDNNLSYDHRLNSIFTVGASAGRQDLLTGGQQSSAYLYSASLKAAPLPGLNNSLVYSGRIDQAVNGTSESNSIFLTNTAQPYKGVAVNLSGGYSLGTDARGQTSENVSFVSGASVAPRQDLSFNMSYNRSITSTSGGHTVTGAPAAFNGSSQSGQLGATYRPFPNMYLFASLGVQQVQNKKTQYVQNYGGTWSPFPDGALQFNMAYNESVNSINSEKNSSLTPSISCKIAPKALLSLSYSLLRTDSLIASTESSYLSAVLRLSF